jgi:AcrR family transcriptional regulator
MMFGRKGAMAEDEDQIRRCVLEAAKALFIYYGYDKTTMNEIASKAKISKSTLYLRWKKKEDLFDALVIRETRDYAEDWFQRVENDPKGGTYGAWMRHAIESFFGRPFLAALYRQDKRVLGVMLKQMGEANMFLQRYLTGLQFFKLMQDANLARKDIDVQSFVYLVNAMHFGLLHLNEMIPEDKAPPIEAAMHTMGDLIEAYVTPDEAGDIEAGKEVLRAYIAKVREMLDRMEDK